MHSLNPRDYFLGQRHTMLNSAGPAADLSVASTFFENCLHRVCVFDASVLKEFDNDERPQAGASAHPWRTPRSLWTGGPSSCLIGQHDQSHLCVLNTCGRSSRSRTVRSTVSMALLVSMEMVMPPRHPTRRRSVSRLSLKVTLHEASMAWTSRQCFKAGAIA